MRRTALIAIPFFWLLLLFAVPVLIAVKISLSQAATAIPPYAPTFDLSGDLAALRESLSQLNFDNYVFLTEDDLYWKAYVSSVKTALIATLFTLIVAYPIAYALARLPDRWRSVMLLLVVLPFWTSFLIRIYSWIGILSNEGLVNQVLQRIGAITAPLHILNTPFAVYVGIVYAYLPFMVLPLFATLEKLDESLLEAAQDLGCSRLKAFWLVTVPLSRPGVIAACFLVFIPAIGEFVIPTLLGGSNTLMIGKVLYEEFFSNRDWPVASAVAVVLLLILVVPIMLFQRAQDRLQAEEVRK
ncbi:ABC transporter permease subunit [Rhodobacter capsulatus]|uniref:ABC transporter permease subunit n=1 Tax=Rhodobacter capsulatus TaxID=1061 RepID=A0A4U1JSI7_RHOCA|nr:ABC transporter permease subunit [Rhodobacter capsulatus]TKD21984.1 ABC transporter permease subunit [Rhodobacter capsulatus]